MSCENCHHGYEAQSLPASSRNGIWLCGHVFHFQREEPLNSSNAQLIQSSELLIKGVVHSVAMFIKFLNLKMC